MTPIGSWRSIWLSLLLLSVLGGFLGGCASSPFAPLSYEFVTQPTRASQSRVSEHAARVGGALEAATLERDVRVLAAPGLQGRRRGTEGNARARAHIVTRLQAAGLAPLFDGSFEQPTLATDETETIYAVNVGAIYRAAEPDASWIVLVAHYDHRGVIDGEVQAGADDNASSVALLLALGDALGRARPALRRHVVLLFPDAEEPPDIRTERMGSSWFWRHPPLPPDRLHLALIFDLMGGRATPELRTGGLGDALFVLGGEADPGLTALVGDLAPVPGVDLVPLSLSMIEAMPYVPGRRFSRSDYHGLREHGQRPFLFLTTGRTETYHTAADTPDTLDYDRLSAAARWVCTLTVHAADADTPLGWRDFRADARTDARTMMRLYAAIEANTRVPALLRRALADDRRQVEALLREWDQGTPPTTEAYRTLLLASIRLQAALWHPSGWWFALW